jgi:hypothetical protein
MACATCQILSTQVNARLDIETLRGGRVVSTYDNISTRLGLKDVDAHALTARDVATKLVLSAGQSSFLTAWNRTICVITLDAEAPPNAPNHHKAVLAGIQEKSTANRDPTGSCETHGSSSASERQHWHSTAQAVVSGAAGGLHYVVCTERGAFLILSGITIMVLVLQEILMSVREVVYMKRV